MTLKMVLVSVLVWITDEVTVAVRVWDFKTVLQTSAHDLRQRIRGTDETGVVVATVTVTAGMEMKLLQNGLASAALSSSASRYASSVHVL